jgi:hypothetical protein
MGQKMQLMGQNKKMIDSLEKSNLIELYAYIIRVSGNRPGSRS